MTLTKIVRAFTSDESHTLARIRFIPETRTLDVEFRHTPGTVYTWWLTDK